MNLKTKKIVGKIVNILLNVLIFIFCIFLLITIYNFIQIKVLKNDHSNFFGYSIFEVQTGSMAPKINAGDWIIVKLNIEPKLNDIVTYKQNNEYITHRVVEVYKGTYITMGDANNSKDEPVDESQIIGKTVKILGGLGILRKTLFNPAVLITLIITLFLFDSLMKKKKIMQDKNDYLNRFITIIVELKNKLFKNKGLKDKVTLSTKKIVTKIKPKKIVVPIKKKTLKKETPIKKAVVEEIKEEKIPVKKIFTEEVKDEDIEENLSKTSVFRVLSVDKDDVSKKYDSKTKKEDLDKTSSFRFINVDTSDLEQKEEKQNTSLFKVTVSKDDEISVKEEVKDDEIDIEPFRNKPVIKKGKNIIDKAMNIKEVEIEEILQTLDYNNTFTNKNMTIKNTFINAYLAIKYYNIYDTLELEETKKSSLKVKKALQIVSDSLIKKERKNEQIIKTYTNIFKLIDSLEKGEFENSKERKEFLEKEFKEYYSDLTLEQFNNAIYKINEIQKRYDNELKELLNKLETNIFELKLNKIIPNKSLYGIEMKHNISFSKVYSDYIVDKTYNEGIVAEDKMAVLFTLLQAKLVKDMLNGEFNKKYLVYIPSDLYNKEKKIAGILNIIDNEYAKNNVLLLVSYNNLIKYKKIIKKLRKDGYKFALIFAKETNVDEKYKGCIYMFDYIFINKDIIDAENILSALPEELLKNISFEDIIGKVGDFLGE